MDMHNGNAVDWTWAISHRPSAACRALAIRVSILRTERLVAAVAVFMALVAVAPLVFAEPIVISLSGTAERDGEIRIKTTGSTGIDSFNFTPPKGQKAKDFLDAVAPTVATLYGDNFDVVRLPATIEAGVVFEHLKVTPKPGKAPNFTSVDFRVPDSKPDPGFKLQAAYLDTSLRGKAQVKLFDDSPGVDDGASDWLLQIIGQDGSLIAQSLREHVSDTITVDHLLSDFFTDLSASALALSLFPGGLTLESADNAYFRLGVVSEGNWRWSLSNTVAEPSLPALVSIALLAAALARRPGVRPTRGC